VGVRRAKGKTQDLRRKLLARLEGFAYDKIYESSGANHGFFDYDCENHPEVTRE
jgi:hypothetical protein